MIVHAIFKESQARWVINEVKYADKIFSKFISVTLLDSALVGIICYIGSILMGIPYALLISVFVECNKYHSIFLVQLLELFLPAS